MFWFALSVGRGGHDATDIPPGFGCSSRLKSPGSLRWLFKEGNMSGRRGPPGCLKMKRRKKETKKEGKNDKKEGKNDKKEGKNDKKEEKNDKI